MVNKAWTESVNPLIPQVCEVTKIVEENNDVKTFHVTSATGKPFTPMPGQLAMVSMVNVGEGMFSISYQGENHLEFAIKRVGMLTNALHEIKVGQKLTVRGPYGNHFPVDTLKGKDLLFVGGGIGLAPLRSLINHCVDNRADFGKLHVVYGARTPGDLCFKDDLFEYWPKQKDFQVDVTVDRGDDNWKGNVGFVPAYLEQLNPSPEGKIAITCGPPIMIKFVLQAFAKMGYSPENIVTTLEMRMKCGVGKCGRCNIGSCYVCVDGPVFTLAQMNKMPDEY